MELSVMLLGSESLPKPRFYMTTETPTVLDLDAIGAIGKVMFQAAALQVVETDMAGDEIAVRMSGVERTIDVGDLAEQLLDERDDVFAFRFNDSERAFFGRCLGTLIGHYSQ
jgi:hypothetical protein